MLVIIHCLNCHCMSNFGNYLQLDDESQQRNIERIVSYRKVVDRVIHITRESYKVSVRRNDVSLSHRRCSQILTKRSVS